MFIIISLFHSNYFSNLEPVFDPMHPTEYMWSEWGAPDKICAVGTQKRVRMCGALRRRLPSMEAEGSPPVYWPRCLIDSWNDAEAKKETTSSLEDCMTSMFKDKATF